jgi:hypothetical protein
MDTKVKENFFSQPLPTFFETKEPQEFWNQVQWETLLLGIYTISTDFEAWELEPTAPLQPKKIFIFQRKPSENKTPYYLGQSPNRPFPNGFRYLSGLQRDLKQPEKEIYTLEIGKKYFQLELFSEGKGGFYCEVSRSPLKTPKNTLKSNLKRRGRK